MDYIIYRNGITQITIALAGAQGGGDFGGYGASFTGVCTVTPGHVLSVVVGQQGTNDGGGGASWVYDSNIVLYSPSGTNGLLSIAAGGGGESDESSAGGVGGTDLSFNSTTSGDNSAGGGINGNGGLGGSSFGGGGGAGWLSNGGNGSAAQGGQDEVNYFAGSDGGGYGGGGGYSGAGGGGGGAGYNGGGGGNARKTSSGGGGGSYLSGTVIGTPVATQTGNGFVTIYQGVPAGTYSVTVTANCGASVTASVTIAQPVSMILSTDSTATSGCGTANGTASVTIVSGGVSPFTYLWNDASSQSTVTATGLSAGNYTVTVTDANTCSSTANADVLNATGLNITGTNVTNESCNGGSNGGASVTLNGGTIPYTYSWSNGTTGNTVGSTISASGLAVNTYTVTVTDNGGCTSTTSLTVTQPNVLSAIASVTNNSCHGSNTGSALASPVGGTSPYTYSWSSGGGTSSTASGLSAGTYTVTVQDSCGESATASIAITQPNALSTTASVIANVICNGGNNGSATATPSDGTSPYTYSWSDGSTSNPTGSVLSAGTYTVTVQDNCGALATASVTITQPNTLSTIATVGANVTCYGESTGNASANTSGGTRPYTYSWSNGSTSNPIGVLSAGTYTVTVQDNCGASVTASVTITQPADLSTTASVTTNVTCNGESTGSASASPSDGSSPYTYSWSPSGGGMSIASGLSAGTYTVTVSDQCSNSATALVTITEPTAMSILRDSASDNGTNNGAASVTISGGTSPYTYSWSPGGETTSSITGQSAGTYTCTVTDNSDCPQTISITIKSSTGIDNISNSSAVNIYPDPNTGYFTITGITPGQVIELYNYMGQKVLSTISYQPRPNGSSGRALANIDISARANGVYLVRILNKDGTMAYTQKIVKTN